MASYLFPADLVSGSPLYSAEAWRVTAGGLIGIKTATRPLGGRTGVWPGTPASTVSVAGSSLSVNPHCGVLDVETPAASGPYLYAIDAPVPGTLVPASDTDQRVDSVFIQMQDPAAGDGSSAPAVTAEYVAGLPGPAGGGRGLSGGPPAVPARAFELAQILVPKSGTGSPVVNFVAPTTVAAGGIIPTSGAAQRPVSPYRGLYVDDPTSGLLRWDGTAWQPGAAMSVDLRTRSSFFATAGAAIWTHIATYDGTLSYTAGGDISFAPGFGWTLNAAGLYEWSASIGFTSNVGVCQAAIDINGTGSGSPLGMVEANSNSAAHRIAVRAGGPFPANAGDTVQLIIQTLDNPAATISIDSMCIRRIA